MLTSKRDKKFIERVLHYVQRIVAEAPSSTVQYADEDTRGMYQEIGSLNILATDYLYNKPATTDNEPMLLSEHDIYTYEGGDIYRNCNTGKRSTRAEINEMVKVKYDDIPCGDLPVSPLPEESWMSKGTRIHEAVEAALGGESDPHGTDAHAPGAKLDAGKLRPGLVLGAFTLALSEVTAVGTYGANKYSDNGWLEVPDAKRRYQDAGLRHWLSGTHEEYDPDTGLPHAAHEAWNKLAVLELMLREKRNAKG